MDVLGIHITRGERQRLLGINFIHGERQRLLGINFTHGERQRLLGFNFAHGERQRLLGINFTHGDLERKEGGKHLFNDALSTFYLRLNVIRDMVNDHSEGKPDVPTLQQGFVICIIPQTG